MLIVAMVMVVPTTIGTAFGVEGRFDGDDAGAEAPHHILDYVVAADDEAIAVEHGRQVAVAQMPGDTDEMAQIITADFGERLGRGNDLDVPAIFKHQPVALAQPVRLFQVEQEF